MKLNEKIKCYRRIDESLLCFWLLIFVSLLLGFNAFSHLKEPIGDEATHAFQIFWFINGQYEVFQNLTMIPTYHGFNAFISQFLDVHDFNSLRAANLILSFGVIPAFYMLVSLTYPKERAIRSLQLLFIPFVFPLFFLVYTDMLSLLFVLLTVIFGLKKHFRSAAICGLMAVAIRQTNIVWVACVCILVLVEKEKFEFSKAFIREYIRDIWPFLIVFLIFCVFVLVNGGLVIGDKDQHSVSLNISNFYFFLIVSFLLYFPFCIANIKNIFNLLSKKKWIIVAIGLCFFIYMLTYEHPHKYNTKELAFYRHNFFIYYTSDVYWLRIISYFGMVWMFLTYWVSAQSSPYRNKVLVFIPFAFFSIVPLPLIEQRYYIVALCLFMAFRPPVPKIYDVILLVIYILLTSYVVYNVSRMIFFL